MSDDLADATASFLEEYDDGERVLETVLEVDTELETWSFDDIDTDSGTFGELVSRRIVEKTDGEYRLRNPDVVSAVITGADLESDSSDASGGVFANRSFEFGIWTDRRALFGLAGALVFLFVMRLTQIRSVFQGEHVVSPGNDPYHYRYWMEQLLAESTSPTDIGVLTDMPAGTVSRPLTHAVNWWLATLLGGDQWAADMVAVWLPVAATLALGVIIYATAVLLTRDVRVGLASILLFALMPVHAVYTGLGFLEHRLHQYLWLGVVLLSLTWLAVDLKRQHEKESSSVDARLLNPLTWVAAAGLGISVGLLTHTWAGPPLLLAPVALYIGLRAVVDARANVPPITATLPVIAGLGGGSLIAAGPHLLWGWQDSFVVAVPAMVFLGAIAVTGLGELWRRQQLPILGLVGLQGVVGVLGIATFRFVLPEQFGRAQARAGDLLFREGFTESVSLFTPDNAIIFGPLVQLGLGFYIGIVVLGWVITVASRRYEPAWLLLGVYVSYFTLLAAIQVRFAAQLAIGLSILAGTGFVYFLSWVELARLPVPWQSSDSRSDQAVVTDGGRQTIGTLERQKLVYLVGIGLLVCGFSLLYVPSLSAQVSHDEPQLEAALAIDEHATEHDREWRDNAVFSTMGDNRMYNYFVSGESRQYRYVDSWYWDYVQEDDPDDWYDRLEGNFGYVIANADDTLPPERLGSDGDRALAHYQLLHVSDDGEIGAFALVEGATINATGEAGETVHLETDVDVDGADPFTYERTETVSEDGTLEVTVAYPGTYTVGDEDLEVGADDVVNGSTVGVVA